MDTQQRIQTAWVKPPSQVGGLDHLAVQAPCINIYGRLLPGITNVTDRARYYSFYPWLIWALDRRGHSKYDDHFISLFRRADCLFSLIAERHAVLAGDKYEDHASAMVGSLTLGAVAKAIEESGPIRLSDYSSREGAKRRYFKNKLGGLGQYYIGVLRELNVLDGDSSSGVKYTRQIGQKLAEVMDKEINGEEFLSVVEADQVSAEQLDSLSELCPCQLVASSNERKVLSELFFVRGDFFDAEALPRRRTLQSIMSLAAQLHAEGYELSESNFRNCTYSQSLPSGASWETHESLAQNKKKWQTYSTNELLSVAIQGLFFALLDRYEESGHKFHSGEELVSWYLDEEEAQLALAGFGKDSSFGTVLNESEAWLPKLQDWINPKHESQHVEQIYRISHSSKSADSRRDIVSRALKVLIALAKRSHEEAAPYTDLVFPKNYFQYYPINLLSFSNHSRNDWLEMSLRDLLGWLLLNWGVNVHFRVALRKLRGQSQSTFRIRPSDKGLEVIRVPPAVHTRPRFNQAVRVLKDIGALERSDDGRWLPSQLGYSMIELGDDS